MEQLQNRFNACETAYFVLGTQKQPEVSGCCGGNPTVHPKLIDVSKSEGTLTFAYEYPVRWTNTIQLDWIGTKPESKQRSGVNHGGLPKLIFLKEDSKIAWNGMY